LDRAPSVLLACADLVCTESRWPSSFARTAAQQGPLVQPASDTGRCQAALKAIQLTLFSCRLSWIQATKSQAWLCATGALAAFALASRHDVAPSCPEAEIKNKTHVNPLGAAPETRQEPEAGRLRTRGERANGTHGRPTEGGTAKREDRRLCDGGNAPSPLHLLPCFCGGSI